MTKGLDYDHIRNLVIGSVVGVSSYSIEAELDPEIPHNLALNAGTPRTFPKINSYVIIGTDADAVVGIVTSLSIKNAPFPKRNNYQEFNIVDLPFPIRQLKLRPIGTISRLKNDFERGVFDYPTIGDNVYLPTNEQLKIIVNIESKEKGVYIGNAPLANNEKIYVNPDKLFGRHCAILGNTGSGKSCTVAGLIRWSILDSYNKRDGNDKKNKPINSRFILLDVNGEYTESFDGLNTKPNIYKSSAIDEDIFKKLKVPVWLWNSEEWINISIASDRSQVPLIKQALRKVKTNQILQDKEDTCSISENDYLTTFLGRLLEYKQTYSYLSFQMKQDVGETLQRLYTYYAEIKCEAARVITEIFSEDELKPRDNKYYSKIELKKLNQLIDETNKLNNEFVSSPDQSRKLIDENLPIRFSHEEYLEIIKQLTNEQGNIQSIQPLINRLSTLFSDKNVLNIIEDENETTLIEWLNSLLGSSSKPSEISIIDLSLVPISLINIVVSVIARFIFEALQRYKKVNGELLPTTIVLEEAHTFINKSYIFEENQASVGCNEIFEKIAREGRKFGLGLVISSQRPSELSPTILSQCNTYILHRIVNDKDQDLVKRLVPDNISALLDELPVLPTRQAIILGWASPLPLLINVRKLDKQDQPKSEDPHFWNVWTGVETKDVDWETIVRDWYEEGGLSSEEIDDILKKTQ